MAYTTKKSSDEAAEQTPSKARASFTDNRQLSRQYTQLQSLMRASPLHHHANRIAQLYGDNYPLQSSIAMPDKIKTQAMESNVAQLGRKKKNQKGNEEEAEYDGSNSDSSEADSQKSEDEGSSDDYVDSEEEWERQQQEAKNNKKRKREKKRAQRQDDSEEDVEDDDYSEGEDEQVLPRGYSSIAKLRHQDESADARFDKGHNGIYGMKWINGKGMYAVWFLGRHVVETDVWQTAKGDTQDGPYTWHHTAERESGGWIMQKVLTSTHQASCPHVGAMALTKK